MTTLNTEMSLSNVQNYRSSTAVKEAEDDAMINMINTETKISKLDLSSRVFSGERSGSNLKSPKGDTGFQLACEDENIQEIAQRNSRDLNAAQEDGVDDIDCLKLKADEDAEKVD